MFRDSENVPAYYSIVGYSKMYYSMLCYNTVYYVIV